VSVSRTGFRLLVFRRHGSYELISFHGSTVSKGFVQNQTCFSTRRTRKRHSVINGRVVYHKLSPTHAHRNTFPAVPKSYQKTSHAIRPRPCVGVAAGLLMPDTWVPDLSSPAQSRRLHVNRDSFFIFSLNSTPS
jgi:hypothetical protein